MLRLSFLRYDAVQMYLEVFTLEDHIKFFKDEFYQKRPVEDALGSRR